MPAGQHQSSVEAVPVGWGVVSMPAADSAQEIGPEPLDGLDCRVEARGQAEAGFGAEKQDARAGPGGTQLARLERMKQRLQRRVRHRAPLPQG